MKGRIWLKGKGEAVPVLN